MKLQNIFITLLTALTLSACSKSQMTQINEAPPHVETFSPWFLNLEISGVTSNFGTLKKDGFVDFGLVIPAIKRTELIYLDLESILSPETDLIDVPFYDFEVPSNVTFPKQKESYFVTITLNKPNYRFYVKQPGSYKMVATHGKFPLKKVIKDLKAKKSMFEIINHFKFIQSGSKNVTLANNISEQNIHVNQNRFSSHLTIKAPRFNSSLAMISIALREDSGLLSPTDLKNLKPGQTMRLTTTSTNESKYVASLLRRNNILIQGASIYNEIKSQGEKNLNEMSLVLQDEEALLSPAEFLPLIPRPRLQNKTFTLNAPKETDNIMPLGTYLGLIEIEDIKKGKMKFEKTARVWEQMTEGWQNETPYPDLDFEFKPNRRYRWVVMFLGQKREPLKFLDSLNLNRLTHVTRNALDL